MWLTSGISFTFVFSQIYDMIQLRHGLMVVGNPLAGKSSALRVLASSLSDLRNEGLMEENKVSS